MSYSDLISRYLKLFSDSWEKYIKGIGMPFNVDNSQLFCGDRLRPQLVFWSYYLLSDDNDLVDLESAVESAIPYESIHKASVILDDILDHDDYRKGKPTFHVQYGTENALICVILLLNSAMEHENFSNSKCIADIIKHMCNGALMEINNKQMLDPEHIERIMKLETSSLLASCFAAGAVSDFQKHNLKAPLLQIGETLGFVFQLLNDCEPFFNENYLLSHKGKLNYDLNSNSRKNYVIAYLSGRCKQDDRLSVQTTYSDIVLLLEKYNIRYELESIVNQKVKFAIDEIDNLGLCHSKEFIDFLLYAFSKGMTRAFNSKNHLSV